VSKSINIPYFPSPPAQYSQSHMAQLVQAFALFAQQVQAAGPERATSLTLTAATGNVTTGILSYNVDEDTVDLTHLNGVTQQIGFETFMRVANDTGVTIPNGSVVGFAGVNGEIKVAPYIADGTVPELYFVGVTTFNMEDQAVGPATLYGKVRGIDTTGTPVSETWAVGDLLYASPTTAGALTKVRPTAPNVVISVAAVLEVDATDGTLMVRPTIPLGLDYGSFDSTVDQTLAAIDTATAITLNNTLSSNGITRGTPTSRIVVAQAGFYRVAASIQLTSGNSSAKNVYFWLRKNGTNVVESTRAITVDINGGFVPIALSYTVSLQPNDYVELYWAADSTAVTLDALAASAFAPAAPAVLLAVTQVQL
jgi:hypothetical protein